MITMRKRTGTLFFWVLLLACGSVAAQQGPGLIAKNPIRLTNVEGRMDHLGVDVKGRRLFATAFDNRTLEVIDLKTGRQIRSITESGKIVASPAMVEHTDDLFYDAGKGRIYVLGEGFIDVWRQMDPDHYDRIGHVATPADSRTGLFVPDLEELFETTPHHGAQGAQIGVYGIQ